MIAADIYISQNLTDNGVSSGDSSLLVDGSVNPVSRFIAGTSPPLNITTLLVYLKDEGTWQPEDFGSELALTNGLTLDVIRDDSSILDLDSGLGIKTNADFGRYTHDVKIATYNGGQTTLVAEIDFERLYGYPLRLAFGEALQITVNDDLSADFLECRAMVNGYLRGAANYVAIPLLNVNFSSVAPTVVSV